MSAHFPPTRRKEPVTELFNILEFAESKGYDVGAVKNKFKSSLEKIKIALIAKYPGRIRFEEFSNDSLYAIINPFLGERFKIYVKYENVMIDFKTGRWYVIDPY